MKTKMIESEEITALYYMYELAFRVIDSSNIVSTHCVKCSFEDVLKWAEDPKTNPFLDPKYELINIKKIGEA